MRDVFSDCHPIVNFLFYIGALIMGMCFMHPLFLFSSVILSFAYYARVNKECLKYVIGMIGLFFTLSFINPLFNTQGEWVLFTYFGERPYTLEALCYGMALAAMFISVLTWFATYNQVMSSDKFLYCFGRLAPAVSLLLTMVLRLVPSFQKKCGQIIGARKCIGKAVSNGSRYEKAQHGMVILSALTSWALEGGVVMADSMRSRGFGSGKRTSFSIYKIQHRDKGLLGFMLVCLFVIMVCAWNGGMKVAYTPQMHISGLSSVWTLLGVIGYFLFLSIPTALSMMEDVRWHILRSKI